MKRETNTGAVRIAGAGAFVPSRIISNERIAQAFPGWSAERILEKTGIVERRYLWELSEEGRAVPPPEDDLPVYPASNTDMCEVALRRALAQAGLEAQALDALFLVTCTPDELNFSHDAMGLHQRLGCRTDAFALVVDDGCGGTPYVMDLVRKMMEGGRFRTVAVVASTLLSPQLNPDVYTDAVSPGPGRKLLNAYLSAYVFGDGAGAVVLRADGEEGTGILASMSGNAHDTLVLRRGGGMMRMPHQGRTRPADLAFVVDGPKVAASYPRYMGQCIEGVLSQRPELRAEVRRYYFHQPNKRLMDRFIQEYGLPGDAVALNVDRYGNTSAAGMLILLAEDLESGRVRLGSGDLVLVAAVGANVHYGAQLIRL
ncbi:3-oxoacyl-[acyl-carrier-protein] synthase III C-terminal domain-containing protein [Stigmatella sp. ncwal1]|uniref:3-oxoacyl-[acyl-carrier-protein] synthase III C-terminal domain-containing protein n=1 Tax=Stigmatella ashevillensis TaxID=2995309 RepID=A0ABT5DDK9_9BACT|nr:3-oxoacyl-[acyl-carrier-protein] synthase III C-terminal domain-containing protein [Stigmatella ashevillena]MDC0711129.1 3-oxoacyl-[acyl-carrier-protein] synthase III C-terminal domain-containing protein [Stigmatella ashevillena]